MDGKAETADRLAWWEWPIVWISVAGLILAVAVARLVGAAMIRFGLRARYWMPIEFAHKASIYALRIRYWLPVKESVYQEYRDSRDAKGQPDAE